MATIKSYTDLEQSKKLAEILPIESADMAYYQWKDDGHLVSPVPFVLDGMEEKEDGVFKYIPCWSLVALRSLLPVGIKINENTYLFESHNTFNKSWVYRYYNEDDASYIYCNDTSEIDACYEMILKLNELNLL